MPEVKVGLIGFGTVGSGVVRVLQKNSALIERKTGVKLVLKKVVDRNIEKKRVVSVERGKLSANVDDILNDPEIGIVIELIGGYSPAKEFIIRALRNGKHVVTANKALLARHKKEIFAEAEKAGKKVFFEASVAGGIPIILSLTRGLTANNIESIEGILNGTCNFILTKMGNEGLEYVEALKRAQELGFAEADPALDVGGFDAMHKLVLLSSLAFGRNFEEKDVEVKGISSITKEQIDEAKKEGKKIKLIAEARNAGGKMSLKVAPKKIPLSHYLANVDNEVNAVLVKGDFSGEVLFVGKGAGMDATASAVVADVIEAAKLIAGERRGKEFNWGE